MLEFITLLVGSGRISPTVYLAQEEDEEECCRKRRQGYGGTKVMVGYSLDRVHDLMASGVQSVDGTDEWMRGRGALDDKDLGLCERAGSSVD